MRYVCFEIFILKLYHDVIGSRGKKTNKRGKPAVKRIATTTASTEGRNDGVEWICTIALLMAPTHLCTEWYGRRKLHNIPYFCMQFSSCFLNVENGFCCVNILVIFVRASSECKGLQWPGSLIAVFSFVGLRSKISARGQTTKDPPETHPRLGFWDPIPFISLLFQHVFHCFSSISLYMFMPAMNKVCQSGHFGFAWICWLLIAVRARRIDVCDIQ